MSDQVSDIELLHLVKSYTRSKCYRGRPITEFRRRIRTYLAAGDDPDAVARHFGLSSANAIKHHVNNMGYEFIKSVTRNGTKWELKLKPIQTEQEAA